MFCYLENPALSENLDFPIEVNPINLEWVDFNVDQGKKTIFKGKVGKHLISIKIRILKKIYP